MKFPAGDGNSAASRSARPTPGMSTTSGPVGTFSRTPVRYGNFYHISWGLARARPRDVRALLRARPFPASRS
jgi:hypothetical protein